MKFFFLIFDNIRRNVTRTVLTSLGTMVLVLVVTAVWSILKFLDDATSEKTSNIKAIITEKWRVPSQMPFSYSESLREGAAREMGDIKPDDSMSWTFYGGSTSQDPKERARENIMFAFCMEPEKLLTMMDELDTLKGKAKEDWAAIVKKLQDNPQGIVVGQTKLQQLNRQVGEKIKLYGLNYKGIDLELEIVGVFPVRRYDQSSVINIEYFNRALFDDYPLRNNNKQHDLAEKSLNLVWVRVPDTDSFEKVAKQISDSPSYSAPAVKIETAASGIGSFLEAYRDIFWAMRVLLAPSIIATLSLVIANSISLSVRERRMEFAVMKVLGFRPWQILMLVIGEALFIGSVSGVISAGGAYFIINKGMGGLPFPIAFFPAFLISEDAPYWGFAIGAGSALAGSLIPAIDACRVRVAEVFGRVG